MSAQRSSIERTFADPNDFIFIQSRAATDEAWINECMEMMQNGVEFDPVQAIRDENGDLYIWDGLHRGEAAKRLGSLLAVEVQAGSRELAQWLALSANQKHGLKRTRADKQKVVREAFLHSYGATLTNREIARHCGVDHKTVGKIRQELEEIGEIDRVDKRTVVRGDQVYEQDTGQIGAGGQDTDQAEDKYMPVWELERAVSSWPLLRNPANDLHDILAGIKDNTSEGRQYFFELQQHINSLGRFRQRDLRQACHNLLEQLRQQRRADAPQSSPAPAGTGSGVCEQCGATESRFWYRDKQKRNLCANCSPYGSESDDLSPDHTPKSQDFECPRCGQERIVGVNGSQRWCLNCGAEWPTAAEFLNEVEVVGQMSTPARTRLQARFAGLLTKLTDEKLAEIDAWLDELENEIPSAEGAW